MVSCCSRQNARQAIVLGDQMERSLLQSWHEQFPEVHFSVSEHTAIPSVQEASAVPVFEERRRKRRTKMKLTARIRPYSFCQELLEEVRATTDFSRAGLSFVTRQRSYREGMHVYVACPYSQYHADKEGDLARVVRVEEKNEGQCEIAIEFVKSSEYNAYHRGEKF